MSPKRRRKREVTPPIPEEEQNLSAAERFAALRQDQAYQRTIRARFIDELSFTPDAFQLQAMKAVEDGSSVLVAAPTGAGKTIVGEFATYLAHERRVRAFYTTPIKALSNQKFNDLRQRYGEEQVGLLTGDTAINADAPIIVMTTEVLRNMIYASSPLQDLGYVVLDEVHYLADRFRGPVWEEVIIHLPQHVQVIGLSATVSNAEEFGAWMREVRGSCDIIVSEQRPVPLYQHMIADGQLYPLFEPSTQDGATSGRLNPELLSAVFRGRGSRLAYAGRHRGRPARHGRDEAASLQTRRFESRPSVAVTLDRAGLLPAIVFIFSRAGVEEAVRSVLTSGLVFTNQREADRIRSLAEEAIGAIPVEDHSVLGVDRWLAALERGVAGHHAGMLPIMKETVELLFAQGLIKLVYATETLALGINMPARTVVIESLSKWNGVAHVPLSAGEYTQLSGRAGRRGIDTEGHAVVLHKGKVAPEEVLALASKRTYPLISAFHPTYNMVVNLLGHSTRSETRGVLERSYAQFQADTSVVHLAQQARHYERQMSAFVADMECSRGDAQEYFRLRDELSTAQKEAKKASVGARKGEAISTLRSAQRGDIVAYRYGRKIQHAVIVDPLGSNERFFAAHVVGTDAKWHQISPADVSAGLFVVGHVKVNPVATKTNKGRKALAERICELRDHGKLASSTRPTPVDQRIEAIQAQVRQHPVHHCDHREIHASAGHQWARLQREYDRILARIDRRTNSVAKAFDKVCDVCQELGYIDGDTVTCDGMRLRRIYGERDILIAEAARMGAFDGLDPAELTALISAFVYEARTPDTSVRIPATQQRRLAHAWDVVLAAQARVNGVESRLNAPITPGVDAGIMTAIYAWASGSTLSTAVSGEDIQAGDFVRWVRQVADALDQLRFLEDDALAQTARSAHSLIMRGVAAWASIEEGA